MQIASIDGGSGVGVSTATVRVRSGSVRFATYSSSSNRRLHGRPVALLTRTPFMTDSLTGLLTAQLGSGALSGDVKGDCVPQFKRDRRLGLRG
jgi:hypothetical protein